MINPEIRHLRAFLAVAEDLHFGRAAARLNIVQPALSAQIQQLEDILGVRLVHRTKRVVALTEPGRLFLDEARRVVAQLSRAVDVAQRGSRGEVGRLAVGYSAATAHSGLLSRVVGAFHRKLPDVKLDIHEMHPALQREALLARDLDVGFVVSNAANQTPEFDSRIVERWDMSLILPADHRLAANSVVPLDELRDDPFISYAALGEDLGVDAFRAAAGYSPRVVHNAETPIMLLSLVGAGLGFGMAPVAMKITAIPGLVFPSTDRAFPQLPAVALFHADNASPALKRFVEGISYGSADPIS